MNNVLNALLKISAKQELHFAVKIDFTLILERIFQKKKKRKETEHEATSTAQRGALTMLLGHKGGPTGGPRGRKERKATKVLNT